MTEDFSAQGIGGIRLFGKAPPAQLGHDVPDELRVAAGDRCIDDVDTVDAGFGRSSLKQQGRALRRRGDEMRPRDRIAFAKVIDTVDFVKVSMNPRLAVLG